ncbi:MAG: DUF4838 domain-containing protein [Clostridia bacterium]|nr:DUF4838 domain-containing protein [Clostridia bacterium]
MKKALLIHPEELSKKWIHRMKSLGVNTLAIHPWGGKQAPQTLAALLEQLRDPAYRQLLDQAAESGLEIEYEFHAAGYLLPRVLFETHPEYFRMNREGERTPDYNLCVSNPEAVAIIAERAATLPKQLYRSSHHYYFWLDDGKDAFCHCPKCKHLSPADQQLIVLNAMITAIRKGVPDAKLAHLAYFETEQPPLSVRPAEGIFLEYAPMSRDMTRPVADSPSAALAVIPKLLHYFGKKDARLLEYWFDNSMYSRWKKPPVAFCPNNDMIRQDLAFYTDAGFENLRVFACFLGADYEELHGEPDLSAFK